MGDNEASLRRVGGEPSTAAVGSRTYMKDLLSVYAPEHRKVLLAVAAASIAGIATIDFVTKPFVSIGFLYLFPIMIVGGFLGRSQIAVVAIGCAILQEAFSSLPESEAVVRLVLSSAGFTGTGLFISELIRNRHIVLRHVSELEEQEKRRKDAEQELQYLVDTSPAAIITISIIVGGLIVSVMTSLLSVSQIIG